MGWSQPAPSTFFRYVTIFLKYEDFNSGRWNSIKNGWPTNQPTSKENPLDFAWTSSFNWGLRLKNNSQSSLYDPDMNGSELETKKKKEFLFISKTIPFVAISDKSKKGTRERGPCFCSANWGPNWGPKNKKYFSEHTLFSITGHWVFTAASETTPPFENKRSGSAFGDDIHNKHPEMFGLTALP